MGSKYIYVYCNDSRAFPERVRILQQGEKLENIAERAELSDVVLEHNADKLLESFEKKYPAPKYDVAFCRASSWAAVQRNH